MVGDTRWCTSKVIIHQMMWKKLTTATNWVTSEPTGEASCPPVRLLTAQSPVGILSGGACMMLTSVGMRRICMGPWQPSIWASSLKMSWARDATTGSEEEHRGRRLMKVDLSRRGRGAMGKGVRSAGLQQYRCCTWGRWRWWGGRSCSRRWWWRPGWRCRRCTGSPWPGWAPRSWTGRPAGPVPPGRWGGRAAGRGCSPTASADRNTWRNHQRLDDDWTDRVPTTRRRSMRPWIVIVWRC